MSPPEFATSSGDRLIPARMPGGGFALDYTNECLMTQLYFKGSFTSLQPKTVAG
jgi:hypothetical protein